MYTVCWDDATGGVRLQDVAPSEGLSEIRPVFHEELDLLGFDRHWSYPRQTAPLLWASGGRRYFYRGRLVAEARGGGFYELPELVVHVPGIELCPVDVSGMLAANAVLLEGLVQRGVEFIYDTARAYRRRVDVASVAFSGGKDSLVLLDLAQRALAPSEFVVVFSDTTMEIAPTLVSVERARQRYEKLSFHVARSEKPATRTWREMGPPSRIHRWCCTVHKSAPSLFTLRELTGRTAVRVLVFDGIRWDESQARAGYKQITEGGKHALQVNASPLVRWNATEVFLYLFSRDLLLNDAYRHGMVRVGCAVCPMSSSWWDSIAWSAYKHDIDPFLIILEGYATGKQLTDVEGRKYISDGGWKGRAGGRVLDQGGSKVIESPLHKNWEIIIRGPNENWLTWIKTIGRVSMLSTHEGILTNCSRQYGFTIKKEQNWVLLKLDGFDKADRFLISHLRAVNNKVAYCAHCKGCEVECPTGALVVGDHVAIDEAKCIHCNKCLIFTERGCLAAKSLGVSKEGGTVKGLNRYQHFGMRKTWLEEFFKDPEGWWLANSLGNRQFDAMRVWLKEAEIIEQKKILPLGYALQRLSANSPLTWLIIWTNLFKNSALINWYLTNIAWGERLSKKEIADRMSSSLSESTRNNAATALAGLLKDTPLGSDIGIVALHFQKSKLGNIEKSGSDNVPPIAVLYALYRYAEETGRYKISLSELYETVAGGPYLLYGIQQDALKKSIRSIANQFSDWIEADLVRDLDNVFMNESRNSSSIQELII